MQVNNQHLPYKVLFIDGSDCHLVAAVIFAGFIPHMWLHLGGIRFSDIRLDLELCTVLSKFSRLVYVL